MSAHVLEFVETPEFRRWLLGLRDREGRARIIRRLRRLQQTGAGDLKPVGGGVSELRVDSGPGYRVYLTRRGEGVVLLLCGGDKDSQKRDIVGAQAIARQTP